MTADQWTALGWEQEYDPRHDAAKTALAEDCSVVERARAVLRRCCLDPTDPNWRLLVHEIGKELANAEAAMLQNSIPIIRAILAEPPK